MDKFDPSKNYRDELVKAGVDPSEIDAIMERFENKYSEILKVHDEFALWLQDNHPLDYQSALSKQLRDNRLQRLFRKYQSTLEA